MSDARPTLRPLLLRGRLRPLDPCRPNPGTRYDPTRQLWVDVNGQPVIAKHERSSDFGETSRTDSHEGVDQSETSIATASDFGETTITKTSEGTDMTEVTSLGASDFGETTATTSAEGIDKTEAFIASDFGETTKSATREGTDQTERSEQ